MDGQASTRGLDTGTAHVARVYDYWLGGKDNFEADRRYGDDLEKRVPSIRITARMNRLFLGRAVRYLAREAGIRQFLDIGTGLPTADNTHEVAQAAASDARIVYVDNDPIVLTHARALLTSSRDGATAYIDADVRDPDRILTDPALQNTIDLRQPVALILLAILHFVDDSEDPHAIVARLVEATAPGSYLVISHATYDPMPPAIVTGLKAAIAKTGEKGGPRDRDQFAGFFTGLELVEPGIVPIGNWRPTPGTPIPDPADVGVYGPVARVP